MNWRLTLVAILAALVSNVLKAEDSIVIARIFHPTSKDCSNRSDCIHRELLWGLHVEKQIKGPKLPRTVFAEYSRNDDKPPQFAYDTTSPVFVVLTPIEDKQWRMKTGADFHIAELSYTWHMYCLQSRPSKYGLNTTEDEIFTLPGTETKCFPTFWAGVH
jgi:hypothetical protein